MAVRIFKNPFIVKKGVTQSFTLRLRQGTEIVDLSNGYEFRTDIRYKIQDQDAIFTLSSLDGGFVFDDEGSPKMVFSKANLDLVDTSKGNLNTPFPFVNVVFDIEYREITSPASDWQPYAMGTVRVNEQGTRSNG